MHRCQRMYCPRLFAAKPQARSSTRLKVDSQSVALLLLWCVSSMGVMSLRFLRPRLPPWCLPRVLPTWPMPSSWPATTTYP